MATTKQQVIDRIEEIAAVMAQYEDQENRAVELIVRSDGTLVLTGEEILQPDCTAGCDPAFEQIAEFESVTHLTVWFCRHAEKACKAS